LEPILEQLNAGEEPDDHEEALNPNSFDLKNLVEWAIDQGYFDEAEEDTITAA